MFLMQQGAVMFWIGSNMFKRKLCVTLELNNLPLQGLALATKEFEL